MATFSDHPARDEYQRRIHRVMDFIEQHLGCELSLEELAAVAHFSPWHFHRVFGAISGETLFRFIQRLRVEKAARLLRENPRQSVTGIALTCGFTSAAVFSRSFRAAFGCTAMDWRRHGRRLMEDRKEHQGERTEGEVAPVDLGQIGNVLFNQLRSPEMCPVMPRKIDVQEQAHRQVAYVRHMGPYQGNGGLFEGLIGRLMAWAGPRGLAGPGAELLAVYHDDPNITAEARLRTSMCLTVPAETVEEGEIGRMELPGGRCVVAEFELGESEYEAAWHHVYADWLPGSGWQPDDRPCFERFLSGPEGHPQGKCMVQICVPVKPL